MMVAYTFLKFLSMNPGLHSLQCVFSTTEVTNCLFMHCFRDYGAWMFEYDILGLNSINKGISLCIVSHFIVFCVFLCTYWNTFLS